ncbi:MAG: hypothetical protein JWM74_1030, partial [Myxococcaceae bacterium]|nr:hypothetical protein [Myxococcaceae bacterium]
ARTSDGGTAGTATSAVPCSPTKGGSFVLRFGIDDRKFLTDVAVDRCSNILLAGSFKSPIDLGGGPLTSAGGEDIFIAKLGTTGAHLYSKRFGDAGRQQVRAVGTNAAGDAYLTGAFEGTLELGGTPLQRGPELQSGIYLTRLGPTGNHEFSRAFFDTAPGTYPTALAVDADGNVAIAGILAKSIDLGGGPLGAELGGIFVAKYNKYGAHRWSRVYPADKYQNAVFVSSVAFDAGGNVLVAGSFEQGLDFGSGKIVSMAKPDVFVAKISVDGEAQWARRHGDTDANITNALAADAAGNVYVAATTERKPATGPEWKRTKVVDLLAFDGEGKKLWQKTFGAAPSIDGVDDVMLRVAPSGELTMVCSITEDMAFGSKALLVEKGTKKLAVVRFDASGKLLGNEAFANDELPFPRGLAIDAQGEIVIAGASDPRGNPQAKLAAGKLPFNVLLQKLAAPGTPTPAPAVNDSGSGDGG